MQGITFPFWSGIQDIAVWQICAISVKVSFYVIWSKKYVGAYVLDKSTLLISVIFFVGLFCVLITAVICLHAQVRLDIFCF